MSGTLVISLDFELMWGVRDHRSVADYGDAVLGVRKALPAILTMFNKYGIHATWATVGLLFARNRQEMLDYFPSIKPKYRNSSLSPLEAIRSQIGHDEISDPFHYGRSLIEKIQEANDQEIATHTFSHFYCLEEGQSLPAFEADLEAAISIMNTSGVRPQSIVFPRNQMTGEHVDVCTQKGINAYRGTPDSYAYRSRSKNDNSSLVRSMRLLDAHLPLTSRLSYPWNYSPTPNSAINVPASRFFRPYSRQLGLINELHIRRITNEMTLAAKAGEVYHLWWHPHNFGRNTDQQLARLEKILKTYQSLSDNHGMKSLTMNECANYLT